MSRDLGERLGLPELEGPFSLDTSERPEGYTDYYGGKFRRAAFIREDGSLVPDPSPNSDLELSFKILGGSVARHICLKLYTTGFNLKKSHPIHLEFYPGIARHITDFSFEHRSSPLTEETLLFGSKSHYYVEWTTTGGFGAGLNVNGFNPETEELLELMRSFVTGCSDQPKIASLVVAGAICDEYTGIEDHSLATIRSHTRVPWHPYLDTHHAPQIFPLMDRQAVKEACEGAFVRFPERNYFSTPVEAFIALTYGTSIEYQCGPNGGTGLKGAWPGSNLNSYLQSQLQSLEKLFDSEDDMHKVWTLTVLNHDPKSLLRTYPITSDYDRTVAVQEMLDIGNWSPEQTTALWEAMAMTGNIMLLQGPPGSGKTRLIAAMAMVYARCGFATLLCAPSTSAAEALATAFRQLLRRYVAAFTDNFTFEYLDLYKGGRDYEEIGAIDFLHKVQRSKVLITTPNVICSDEVCEGFGESAEGLMILHDDSHMSLESECLATVFALRHKPKGLIMACDCLEWPMDVVTQVEPGYLEEYDLFHRCLLSSESKPYNGLNEFADQVGLHLAARLVRQGFPVVRLQAQYRMAASMTEFLKKRVYQQFLQNAPSVPAIPSDLAFAQVVRTWFTKRTKSRGYAVPTRLNSTNFSLSFINVTDGWVTKAEKPKNSKWNGQNVDVIVDLLLENHKAGAVRARDIVVVTYYRAQVLLYRQILRHRANRMGIDVDDLPYIITLDSFRGREAPIVILDTVVHDKRGSHQLGMVSDEYRAIVATTRAKQALMIVGSMKILENSFIRYWSAEMSKLMMDPETKKSSFVFSQEKVPYIIDYAENLLRRGLVFDLESGCFKNIQYREPKDDDRSGDEGDRDKEGKKIVRNDSFQDPWKRRRNHRVHDGSAKEEHAHSQGSKAG